MNGLEAIEERIARLERVVGSAAQQTATPPDSGQGQRSNLLDILGDIDHRINALYEGAGKIKTLSELILQFQDLLEDKQLDSLVPDDQATICLCESAKPTIEKNVEMLKEMKSLEPLLESEHIKSAGSFQPKMLSLLTLHETQAEEVRKHSSNVDTLIQKYNIFIECIEKQFILWDVQLRKWEALQHPDVEDSLDIA